MLRRWKQAVVHLECATDSKGFAEQDQHFEEMRTQLQEGKLSKEEFDRKALTSRDVRFQGTALFIVHAGRRYLVTARHVLWDEIEAERCLQEEVQRPPSRFENIQQLRMEAAAERARQEIFSIIFRVRKFGEDSPASRFHPNFLMNVSAGGPHTYTFTDDGLDLAVISLDERYSEFADELVAQGYAPVESDDIADGPDSEGQEVFAVGFPGTTAVLGRFMLSAAEAHWTSTDFSLPVTSFGRVSMLHDGLPFFWVDMSIYPGNSGGPVVANDQLVGIVTAQATISVDGGARGMTTGIPFGYIIKSRHVLELLRIQEQKDLKTEAWRR